MRARARVLQVLGDLTHGDGAAATASTPHGEPREAEWPFHTMLTAEDEQLVVELRAGLAKLAESWQEESVEVAAAVKDVLDSAEFVTRCHLLGGRSARIPQLLPSFVFLALTPRVGRLEAMSIAERSAQLLRRG